MYIKQKKNAIGRNFTQYYSNAKNRYNHANCRIQTRTLTKVKEVFHNVLMAKRDITNNYNGSKAQKIIVVYMGSNSRESEKDQPFVRLQKFL